MYNSLLKASYSNTIVNGNKKTFQSFNYSNRFSTLMFIKENHLNKSQTVNINREMISRFNQITEVLKTRKNLYGSQSLNVVHVKGMHFIFHKSKGHLSSMIQSGQVCDGCWVHSLGKNITIIGSLFRPYKMSIRNYPGGNFLNSIGVTKAISPAGLLQQKLLYNKAVFFKYCKHFKDFHLTDLLNDHQFIAVMSEFIVKEPTLHSRAFQLALEVTYSKRKFSQDVLETYFKNDFKIVDSFNVNKGLCDQSTIYTALSMQMVQKYFGFSKEDVVVYSTPIYLQKDFIEECSIKQQIETNQVFTGNSVADGSIKDRVYDFKETKELIFSKNHIYFIDVEILTKSDSVLRKMEVSLKGVLKNDKNSHLELYTKELLKIISNRVPNETSLRKLETIYKYIEHNQPPHDFKFPYIVPRNNILNVEDYPSELSKITLDQGHLDFIKSKKAIMGILDCWDNNIKRDIQTATYNSIQFLTKDEVLD